MPDSPYRRLRRLLRPIHPNRLLYYARHGINLLGWPRLRNFLRLLAHVLHPRRVAATARFLAALPGPSRRRRRETRLTVAVDISAFWERLTGIGWYLFRLLEHLKDRDDLRLRLYGLDLVATRDLPPPVVEPPSGPAIERVRYPVPHDLSVGEVQLAGALRALAKRVIAADRNEILFAPNYFLPPTFDHAAKHGRLVATIHDLGVLRVPETLRESTRLELEQHLRETLERAARILTDSETVRGELLDTGLVTAERVHTVHLAPAASAEDLPANASPPEGTPQRYVLHVGTLEPRKRLETVLAAWRLLRERADRGECEAPPTLLLCGGWGWKTDTLRADVERAEDEGWLRHFGYLADAEVTALYRGAELVVLPSIYEGFGLPAVEAMTAGAPLLASDIPVLREIAGDAAAYAAPEDPAAWADAVAALLADPERRADLARRGREHCRRYTWKQTADATAAVWRAAAGRTEEVSS